MPSPRPELSRRAVRWLWPAALLALTPKCMLCAAAYAGIGAALGLGGPEICGASIGLADMWTTTLAWIGLSGGLGMLGLLALHRRWKRAPARRQVSTAPGWRKHTERTQKSYSPISGDVTHF